MSRAIRRPLSPGGGSCVVNPLGDVIAGPVYDEESVLYADLDLDDVVRGKFDLDTVGHYARPDIFELSVNTKRSPGVRESEASEFGLAEKTRDM